MAALRVKHLFTKWNLCALEDAVEVEDHTLKYIACSVQANKAADESGEENDASEGGIHWICCSLP